MSKTDEMKGSRPTH